MTVFESFRRHNYQKSEMTKAIQSIDQSNLEDPLGEDK